LAALNLAQVRRFDSGMVVDRISYQLAPFKPQIQTNSIEIVTGPVAYDKRFGPTIVDLATALGLITPEQSAYYYSLPNGPEKEGSVLAIVNGGLAQLGYNQLSLFDNPLPNVELLPGQIYTSTNTYGWTEFTFEPDTHQLDIKTWGILPYSKAELDADPAEVTSRTPVVVREFTVTPL